LGSRASNDAGGIFAYARQTGMIAGWYEQKIDEPPQVSKRSLPAPLTQYKSGLK